MITEEDIKALSCKKFNSKLIKATEDRVKEWKEIMSWPFKFKEEFKDTAWFHEFARYFKNEDETRLKKLIHDQMYTFDI